MKKVSVVIIGFQSEMGTTKMKSCLVKIVKMLIFVLSKDGGGCQGINTFFYFSHAHRVRKTRFRV